MKHLALLILLVPALALATPPKKGETNVRVEQNQAAIAGSASDARSRSESSATVSGVESHGGDAHAEGGHATGGDAASSAVAGDSSAVTEINDNSESNNTNVVLVPNNNTAGCQRVYGLSFGNGDGAGGLGLPFRDKSCDFEHAADDAAAIGQHKVAWFWRCHKPNLYKTFDGASREERITACHTKMVDMLEPEKEIEERIEVVAPQAAMMLRQDDSQYVALVERLEKIEALRAEDAKRASDAARSARHTAKLTAEAEQSRKDHAQQSLTALQEYSK